MVRTLNRTFHIFVPISAFSPLHDYLHILHSTFTAKNVEHTIFPQTWLIPEQSGLQYGLQPKIQGFLLFNT